MGRVIAVTTCKSTVEKQPAPTLKSLRFSLDEEDEDFCGFIHDDVKDRSDWVKHQVTVLKETQELIDQFVQAEPVNVAAGRVGALHAQIR